MKNRIQRTIFLISCCIVIMLSFVLLSFENNNIVDVKFIYYKKFIISPLISFNLAYITSCLLKSPALLRYKRIFLLLMVICVFLYITFIFILFSGKLTNPNLSTINVLMNSATLLALYFGFIFSK